MTVDLGVATVYVCPTLHLPVYLYLYLCLCLCPLICQITECLYSHSCLPLGLHLVLSIHAYVYLVVFVLQLCVLCLSIFVCIPVSMCV